MRLFMYAVVLLGVSLIAVGVIGRLGDYEDAGARGGHLRLKAHKVPTIERILYIGFGVGLIYFAGRSLRKDH